MSRGHLTKNHDLERSPNSTTHTRNMTNPSTTTIKRIILGKTSPNPSSNMKRRLKMRTVATCAKNKGTRSATVR
jgi:hypothetical protein